MPNELEPIKASEVEQYDLLDDPFDTRIVDARVYAYLAALPKDAKGNVLVPEMEVCRVCDGEQCVISAVSSTSIKLNGYDVWHDAGAVYLHRPDAEPVDKDSLTSEGCGMKRLTDPQRRLLSAINLCPWTRTRGQWVEEWRLKELITHNERTLKALVDRELVVCRTHLDSVLCTNITLYQVAALGEDMIGGAR